MATTYIETMQEIARAKRLDAIPADERCMAFTRDNKPCTRREAKAGTGENAIGLGYCAQHYKQFVRKTRTRY